MLLVGFGNDGTAIWTVAAMVGVVEVSWSLVVFVCEVRVGVIPVVWASRHAHGPTTGGSHVGRISDMVIFSENVEKCHVTVTCRRHVGDR